MLDKFTLQVPYLFDLPPWALIKFLDLESGRLFEVGAYSRWALIRGWALIKFSPFSRSVTCIFCNKTVNGNNKTGRCNKARFCKTLWRKLRLRASLWLVGEWAPISVWVGVGGGWGRGGRLFEAGRLLTFSANRMGAYSRWALIRGWALIRINTVNLGDESGGV